MILGDDVFSLRFSSSVRIEFRLRQEKTKTTSHGTSRFVSEPAGAVRSCCNNEFPARSIAEKKQKVSKSCVLLDKFASTVLDCCMLQRKTHCPKQNNFCLTCRKKETDQEGKLVSLKVSD